MPRMSATSNPTGLRTIERSRIIITVSGTGNFRSFTLDRLSCDGLNLAGDMRVIVIATAGNTAQRFDAGSVANPLRDPCPIGRLDSSQPLRFRLLIRSADSSRLIASAEGIRPHDQSQSESLLPMEGADLGERLWRLLINEDGPVLQFNSTVFPNAAGAEGYLPFGAFVLPEALRQVMQDLARRADALEDESDAWYPWRLWLEDVGMDLPDPDGEDEELIEHWCDEATDRFCQKFSFGSKLRAVLEGARDD